MAGTVETVSIAEEVRTRFLRYMVSVVKGRALPDARDGLKPVQRRILYSMYHDSRLLFDRKATKCAKIVGEVMGNYHPHGDNALYEALVRMSQEWVLRLPLVYGEGNFGSVDGDPPAAYRYTEAKLSRAAEPLLDELDYETVDTAPTYDGSRREPVVLPAQYPNLLVNGTSGIAVGLATNIPPHNLGEVLRACILLIDEPEATTAQLLEKVKGPDFPLGGKIVTDKATLRRIYEEGRGSIKVQAEWNLEDMGRNRQQIVVTSIPYGVEKGPLESLIGGLIEDRKLPQLLGVANETNDKDGLRTALEIKPGTDPNLIMAYLYKHTELQKTFSYNMTAVVPAADGVTLVPRDGLSLKELLRYFLDFRLVTVRKRHEYHLRQLQKRIHILEGFAVVFDDLDEAIRLIRTSTGKGDAAEKLTARFALDAEQVAAILDAQLYKIASMEIQKIRDELAEKRAEAERLTAILESEPTLWGIVRSELEALAQGPLVTRRKSRMAAGEDVLEFDEDAYIVRENTNVVLTRDGWLKRVGRLASVDGTRVREGDAVTAVAPASTLDTVVFLTDDGAAYTMRVNEVPASSGYGEPLTKFFKLADRAKVVAVATTDARFTPADAGGEGGAPPTPHLLVVTSAGMVSRLPLSAYRAESTKAGRRYAKVEADDRVVFVSLVRGDESVMLASKRCRLIQFPVADVPALSGVGKGVIGLKLDAADRCVGAVLVRGRFDKLAVETAAGKVNEYGPGLAGVSVARGNRGVEVAKRAEFVRVVPPEIELADWDAVEGKAERRPRAADADGN